MITKTQLWKNIKSELIEMNKSKKMVVEIMEKIKSIPQNEDQKEKA
tara:strand:+ start:560 stop:697 length:138 start_codon:yes stop_codon:yes gene_type:complete